MLTDNEWTILIERISRGQCTPFLGAGACYGVLPLGQDMAESLANRSKYPLEDSTDLIRVTQFIALTYDGVYPKELVVDIINDSSDPDFKAADEPHRVLADLPLPLYMTTNYDDFMVKALKRRRKDPRRELCRWNSELNKYPSVLYGSRTFTSTVANPVVFHLHGHTGHAASLVLTEDDYMDFMANVSIDPGVIPPAIAKALTQTTLLFLGYRLADWNFRVVLRSLSRFLESGLRRRSFAVMLPPTTAGEANPEVEKYQEAYLTTYYDRLNVTVYWGTIKEFFKELKERAGNAFD